MDTLTLHDLPSSKLAHKRVLVRVDFNVPLQAEKITDDSRIIAALPTIQYLLDHNASVILLSHLGRPKGKKATEFSLAPCAKRLSELLKKKVILAPDCRGEATKNLAKSLNPSEVLMLENLRFYEAEEDPSQDPSFAKDLAELGDLYVNDAFGAAHRKHSSTYTITQYFQDSSIAGFLLEKETLFLEGLLKTAKRPFYAILGGAKVSTKVGVIFNLLNRVDALFIGGAMAYTFFKQEGIPIGDSLVENGEMETVKKIIKKAKELAIPLYLPSDLIVANRFADDAESHTVFADKGIPEHYQGMDIGPATRKQWALLLQKAETIFWNGPLGVFEFPHFAAGTETVATALAESSAITIVGGGDSLAAINQLHLEDRFTHLSTGGGASLEYLEFNTLPALEVLTKK